MKCKFCGKEIKNIPVLKSTEPTSCPECNSYCNRKCKKHGTQTLSWHKEPCVSCDHNPYRKMHVFEDGRWKKKG